MVQPCRRIWLGARNNPQRWHGPFKEWCNKGWKTHFRSMTALWNHVILNIFTERTLYETKDAGMLGGNP